MFLSLGSPWDLKQGPFTLLADVLPTELSLLVEDKQVDPNVKNVVCQHMNPKYKHVGSFTGGFYGNTLTFSSADKGKLSSLPQSNWMCNFDHHQHIRSEKHRGHNGDLKMRGL